ncbi:C40 family peptidase [Lactococcus kimchii]|uniref:C40 family peptidase n=1 Tax=Lactococcus sp. S-13 TaxID=2507158 RepID=UPI0010232B5A|nr:C40 family peptidase [Lactococcus sp. S-13]RZI48402.1 NlpC/P60 family protein [Lactococcus sp. S-13]
MLKKFIFAGAILTSFAFLPAPTAKADSVLNVSKTSSLNSLTKISEATDSLTALTETMDKTVSTISQENLLTNNQNRADKLVSTAKKYLGVPYVWGGTTPAGFDCSGFTSYVYREALGKEIGRTTWNQIDSGQRISLSAAKVGDLIIFYGGDHVGIYLGNGQVIHAPQPGESVKISSVSEMPADFALEY